VVIAEGTRRLVGRLFVLDDLGRRELKGFAAPVPAYAVRGEAHVQSRFEAFTGGRLAPLVGRGRELGLLLRAWDAYAEWDAEEHSDTRRKYASCSVTMASIRYWLHSPTLPVSSEIAIVSVTLPPGADRRARRRQERGLRRLA
jgi:hypothetical protein